jgi:RNA polymerase sigma factor (sigma-70 family)
MRQGERLVEAFLGRRHDMRRYFAARVSEAEADDLVQETYLRVAALAPDTDVRSPGAYLYRLGNNIMLDHLRRQRAGRVRDTHWHDVTATARGSGEYLDDAVPVDRAMIARDRLDRLRAALADLPDPVQQTFHLHKVDGLSYAEIAAKLGVSRSLIEKRMMRALGHLASVAE